MKTKSDMAYEIVARLEQMADEAAEQRNDLQARKLRELSIQAAALAAWTTTFELRNPVEKRTKALEHRLLPQ